MLAAARQQFEVLSGRLDLFEDAIDEQGRPNHMFGKPLPADEYIRGGQRFLELHMLYQASAEAIVRMEHHENIALLEGLRVLEKVFIVEPFMQELPKDAYELSTVLHSPDVKELNLCDSPTKHIVHIPAQYVPDKTAVKIHGCVPGVYKFVGKFWSTELRNATDFNYWTRYHLFPLVWSALYILEVGYRNNAGAQTWLQHVTNYVDKLDNDRATQESCVL